MELQQRKAAEIAELDIQTQEQKILLKELEVTEAVNASNNLDGDELLKKIYEFLTQTTSANNKTDASTAGSSERRNNKGDLRQLVEDCLQNAERPLSSGDIYERIKDKLPYGIGDQTAITAKVSTILSSLKLYGRLQIFPGKGKRSTYLYKQEQ